MSTNPLPFIQQLSLLRATSSSFAFIGPGYQSQSLSVDGERCVNLYTEAVGQDGGHSSGGSNYVLVGTPGRKLFATLPDPQIRNLFFSNGRLFAVASGNFYELQADGSFMLRGGLNIDPRPASICSNGIQLFILSGGQGFIYDLNKNTLVQITNANWNGAFVGTFLDQYFITFSQGTRTFWISGILDGLNWGGLDFAVKEGSPDNLVSILADHEELWLFGNQTTEIWYNSGNNNFPFQRIQGALIEQGCAAAFSPVQLDNSIFWIGADARGQGICWRANGYIPTRISNHAVEYHWAGYKTISDAIAWSYQENGHTFYVVWFPDADKTWAYDVATGHWHERALWDTGHGIYHGDVARCYCTAWEGMHLVGDRLNGNVYVQSLKYFDDNGAAIRRLRSSPHVKIGQKRNFFPRFLLDMQFGIVPQVPLQGSAPIMSLRISNDGGYKFGNYIERQGAPVGRYRWRLRWDRLGSALDRVYEVTTSEPVEQIWIDAYPEIEPGTGGV